jgi:hypothetical protein
MELSPLIALDLLTAASRTKVGSRTVWQASQHLRFVAENSTVVSLQPYGRAGHCPTAATAEVGNNTNCLWNDPLFR